MSNSKKVSYEELLRIEDKEKIQKRINSVLRAVGTRFASSDISKCQKTESLAYDFGILKNTMGGPKCLLRRLSELDEPNAEKKRIKHMMKFKYIKNKGSRDFLMELGLVRNAIALDARIQAIFERIGIEFRKDCISNNKKYDEMEKDILEKICEPLNLLGVQFDRMLYQNEKEIMRTV